MNTKEFNETIDTMCSNFNISRQDLEQGAAIPKELPDEEQEFDTDGNLLKKVSNDTIPDIIA